VTVIELPRAVAAPAVDGALMSWWDADAKCTVAVARPSAASGLWEEYLSGAERSYASHDIADAIDVSVIRSSGDTAVFFAMLDATGTVVGGIRAIGPLTSPDETHAVTEWANHPSLASVRKMIADRIPFGVVEMKSAWVTGDAARSRRLTATLARTGCHVLAVLGVQFCMATCAHHVLARRRGGADPLDAVPRRAVPDENDVVGQVHRRRASRTRSDHEDRCRNGRYQ
jgi:hypothetical protein